VGRGEEWVVGLGEEGGDMGKVGNEGGKGKGRGKRKEWGCN